LIRPGYHAAHFRTSEELNMKSMIKLVVVCCVLTALSAVRVNAQETLFRSTAIGSTPGQIIGGVLSGGAPWQVTKARISLSKKDGELEVSLRGLVLVSTGVSPVSQIAASLVCGGSGGAVAATTDAFALSTDGNSEFEQQITLPSTCLAPVVIVRAVGANGPGAFIAATGFNATTDSSGN
jgi:hypothetical protein